MVLPLRPVLFSGRGDHRGASPATGQRVRRKSLARQRGADRHPPGRRAHPYPLHRQRGVLGERQNAPAGTEYPSQPAAAVRRAMSGAWILCPAAAEEKTVPGYGHPGVSFGRQRRELEVPADECHRPVYALRIYQRGIYFSDGERGVSGAMVSQPEEYHLHHAPGHEVPG